MAEEKQAKSIDQATLEMIAKATEEGITTVFDRAEKMKPCPIGADGSCCKNCAMGPCRVPLAKGKEETPEEKKARVGVCGATAETISARNFCPHDCRRLGCPQRPRPPRRRGLQAHGGRQEQRLRD